MEAIAATIKHQKYQAYKPSQVEWLGDIPEHWEAVRMKFLFKDVSIKNRPNAELLSVTQDQGVVPRTLVENRMVMPSGTLESFKFIQKGDFAISLRSFEGGLEYCHQDGIISPAYTVLEKKEGLDDRYFKYLFKSFSFISEIQTSVVGIRQGKNISYPELSYSLLPIPDIGEQTAIAHFLDDKTAKIDLAIAQKEKLIELLKERKQILIQNAVTKGLDPNVKMKDSGVEWIGEIPEGWEVKRLKFLVNITGGFAFDSTDFTDSGVQLIKIANTYQNSLSLDRQPTFVPSSYLVSHKQWIVEKGDVLMSLTGTMGKTDYGFAIKVDSDDKFLLNQRVARLIPVKGINSDYLLLLLQSDIYLKKLYSLPSGTKQANLSNEDVTGISVPIPSSLEMIEILSFIKSRSIQIDTAVAIQNQQIEKLKEYKATLIDSAVTGKIKVN